MYLSAIDSTFLLYKAEQPTRKWSVNWELVRKVWRRDCSIQMDKQRRHLSKILQNPTTSEIWSMLGILWCYEYSTESAGHSCKMCNEF